MAFKGFFLQVFFYICLKADFILAHPLALSINITINLFLSRDGAVVRALASHQCGPGSILGLGVICGLSLLLVLSLLREVFLRVLRFSPLLKNQHSKFQLDLESVPN